MGTGLLVKAGRIDNMYVFADGARRVFKAAEWQWFLDETEPPSTSSGKFGRTAAMPARISRTRIGCRARRIARDDEIVWGELDERAVPDDFMPRLRR